MAKSHDVHVLCQLVGANVASVLNARDGWPGLVKLQLSYGPELFSVHVGRIHSMSRGKPHELRFQNPGQNRPVRTLPETRNLLLVGIWEDGGPPVLVAGKPELRLGEMTRQSYLFHKRIIDVAQLLGWAEPYRNNKGDLYWAFFPQLLPAFAEMYLREVAEAIDSQSLQVAVVGAGLVDNPEDASATRARRMATVLVRKASFRVSVVEAYDHRCSMCGLNLGLVTGAHILPVSAPGSTDDPTNGLALCDNHHRAFDDHKIWVCPERQRLNLHPKYIEHANKDEWSKAFVATTFPQLRLPVDLSKTPNPQMFVERYDYFKDQYEWVV